MNRPWSDLVFRLFNKANRKKAARPAPRLSFEHLEDRVVPATTITIIPGVAGTGTLDGFLSATDGTINNTDSQGVVGSVSQGALQAVGAGIQVSITAESAISFTAPVALLTNAGNSAQFIALNGNVSFANPATDTLSTAGGSLTLVATNGGEMLGNLLTNNGNINLITDAVALVGTVNAGTGIVSIAPSSTATAITVGGGASGLGVSDGELNLITASVVRIGDNALNHIGSIVIDGAVTRHLGFTTLGLYTANIIGGVNPLVASTTGAITQTAGSNLSVANLAIGSVGGVQLTNAGNNIDKVAANVTGAVALNNNFRLVNAPAGTLTVGTVDGIAGITVAGNNFLELTTTGALTLTNGLTTGGGFIGLLAGGAVTQGAGAGAAVSSANLELLGAGPYTLTNVNNNVSTLAASVTNAVSYTDADALNIASLTAVDTFGGMVTGVSTTSAAIAVNTVNGALVVASPVNAVSSTVALTAGSTGTNDNALTLNAGVTVTGTGGVTLTADNIIINAGSPINAGTSTATLQPFQAGTLINLGGADGANTLGLTPTEINQVTANGATGKIVIGNATAGDMTVTAPFNPTGTSQLELVTGGAVLDANVGLDFTVTRLGITAGTGISVSPGLNVIVSNLEATTATGGISIGTFVTPVTLGGVNATLTGVRTTTSGDITITSDAGITVGSGAPVSVEGVSTAGGGSITLTATNAANITVNGAVASAGGNGNIAITAQGAIVVAAPVSAVGTGNVTITADTDLNTIGNASNTGAGTVTTAGGDISFTGSGVNIAAPLLATAGDGDISVTSTGPVVRNVNVLAGGTITTTGTTGDISLSSQVDISVAAAVSAGGTGIIVATADNDGNGTGVFTNTATGTLATAGGNATITAADVTVGGTINVTTGATSIVTLTPSTSTAVVHLGTDTAFGLLDTELDLITAGVLRVGSATNTGGVMVDGQVSLAPALVPVLHLTTAGAITDNTATEQDDITVQSLALSAGTGVGSADALNVAVTNLAIANTTSNNIALTNNLFSAAGPLNITTVDGVVGSTQGGNGNTTISNTGAINVLQPVVNVGTGFITLTAGGDVTLAANVTAPTNTVTITTPTNIIDDGVDTTVVTAGTNIVLSSGGRMGGSTPITVADVESASTATPTAAFRSALDVAYGGIISLTQTGALGNVEIRKVGSPLSTSSVVVTTPASFVGNNNQFALISAGGALTVNTVFTVNGANNANLLLATTGGSNLVFNAGSNVINNGNSTTALAATGIGAAIVTPAGDGSPEVQVQNLILDTTGGAIGAVGAPLEFNTTGLNGQTTGLVNGVAQAGGTAFLTDTSNGLTIGQFNAGTGNVTLTSLGNITPSGSSIIGASPNDGVAEIIGNVVTLAATGASTGNGGQIGFFTVGPGAQFFEVNATTLNASTNNSRLWISDVAGGVAVGSGAVPGGGVNAGTNTAFLRVRNGGSLTGPAPDGTADVVAATINLSAPEGGNFGGATPLEIDAATALVATVTGTGNINLRDTAGGLTVQTAATGSGSVTLDAAGAAAALVLGTAGSTVSVVTASTAATLTATGAITSAAGAGVMDVVAATLTASAAGVGTSGVPLETTVGGLTASGGAGGVFVTNTGALALQAIMATGAGNIAITTLDTAASGENLTANAAISTGTGNITLQAGDNLTVNGAVSTTGAGVITLAGDVGNADAGTGTTVTIGATGSVSSTSTVQLTGGTDADTFNTRTFAAAPLSVTGSTPTTLPGDVLNLDLTGLTPVFTPTGVGSGTVTSANGTVGFTGIETTNFSGAPVALTLDMAAQGFQDGNASPDVVNASVTAGVLNVTVQSDSAGPALTFFNGAVTGVSSLTVTGSTDRETVIIDETNMPAALPIFVNGGLPTTAPGDTLVVNTTNATNPVFTPGVAGAGTFSFGNRAPVTFTGIESVATAIVSIAVTDATASEKGALQAADTARFTLTRQGDLTNALPVTYTVGGMAANGVDYAALSGTVTFAAGSATAVIDIVALNNSRMDGTRTVTVTLTTGANYTLASGPTASASILDNDRPVSRIAVSKAVGRRAAVFDNGSATATIAGDPFPDLPGTNVAVAVGDVDGDGIADVIATEVFRGATLFRVFDGATLAVRYTKNVGGVGPVTAAVGDTDGDGRGEIVLGLTKFPAFGVFDGVSGAFRYGVNAYPGAAVGISVATGDLDGDGKAEIITAPNRVAPLIRVFNGTGGFVREFFAFDPKIAAVGATVAAGDVDGDGKAEIIVGTAALGTNFVLTFNGNGAFRTARQLIPANNTISKFGPPVATGDLNGDGLDEVLVTVGPALGALNGQSLDVKSVTSPFPGFNGGIYLG